jgi:methylmalonyl-CoA/ethylmalonyl-CoA epimerase
MAKGKLRHIAMSVKDPWKTAEFYKAAFDMEVVGETDSDIAEGVFLSDGVINLALLAFKSDEMAQGTGKDFVGLHHLGFWIDDPEESQAAIKAAGGKYMMGEVANMGGGFYEIKYHDPNGVIVDISHNGWGGAQKNPGAADNTVGPVRKTVAKFDARRKAAKQLEPAGDD